MGVDSADTIAKEKNLLGQFQYFQITQPGSNTVTPLHKYIEVVKIFKIIKGLYFYIQICVVVLNFAQAADVLHSVSPSI